MNLAEKKITQALGRAVDFRKQGASPNKCLIAAAKEADLNPDMTERLVEGFNIALTNSTLKSMPDKTASFPIAQKEAVLEGVFGNLTPRENKKEASRSDAPFFSISRSNPNLNWPSSRMGSKEAQFLPPIITQAHSACDQAKNDLSKVAQDLLQASLAWEKSYGDLCRELSLSGGANKFAALERQALTEFGPDASAFLDGVYESAGLDRLKIARFSGEVESVAYFPPTQEWNLLQSTLKHAADFGRIENEFKIAAAETARLVDETQGLVGELTGGARVQKDAADFLVANAKFAFDDGGDDSKKNNGSDVISTISRALPSQFNSGRGMIPSAQTGMASAIGEEHQKAYMEGQRDFYRGPKDENQVEMDNIRRSRILAELVSSDEIISRIPPKDIERSYGSLLTLAPQLTLDPNIVAGWLRNSSSTQALDPFSAAQLVKTQQDLTKNKLLESGQLKSGS